MEKREESMPKTPELFIFRTNIETLSDFVHVRKDLQRIVGVLECTIDLEDRDRVLRVETENRNISIIVDKVVSHGFFCEELED